ncbi:MULTISPECIES: YbaB/EbfC family nucleoid-associated protein [unclassified Saccharopolyspora]|uniref:YbaB/EbfC family nucleoid-associated protein n=1 Tax=Saccharopolyspora TaxID=1835 RepID=UPI0019097623|nr:YbaB/EbfC family nucleoid-associated protein [Saccharopolyspora sp. HNM0986]MBK0865933.1 YbaB/EbfC family nucleoid-associated protein [Saccharopolyspora sp. HNM0986]
MTDPKPDPKPDVPTDIDSAMSMLERERERVADVTKQQQGQSTTVQAKDHSLEATFDGSGELTGLKFNGNKYRSMAPAQLASVIVETIQAGRTQSMTKLTEQMSGGMLPGVDLAGIASGKVDPSTVLDQLMKPIVGMAEELPGVPREKKDRRDG